MRQLHREFLRAGADVMQTFTFYASDSKLGNRGNTASEKIGVSNDSFQKISVAFIHSLFRICFSIVISFASSEFSLLRLDIKTFSIESPDCPAFRSVPASTAQNGTELHVRVWISCVSPFSLDTSRLIFTPSEE